MTALPLLGSDLPEEHVLLEMTDAFLHVLSYPSVTQKKICTIGKRPRGLVFFFFLN